MTPRHREALANLQYGIRPARASRCCSARRAPARPRSSARRSESDACRSARILHLNNPALKRNEFIEFLAARLRSRRRSAMTSKTTMLRELERVLQRAAFGEETIALVIDGRRACRTSCSRKSGSYANIETSTEKLLPVVLAGRPEAGRPAQRDVAAPVETARGAALPPLACSAPRRPRGYHCRAIACRRRRRGADLYARGRRDVAEAFGRRARAVNVICRQRAQSVAIAAGAASGRRGCVGVNAAICEEFDLASAPTSGGCQGNKRGQQLPVASAAAKAGQAPRNEKADVRRTKSLQRAGCAGLSLY